MRFQNLLCQFSTLYLGMILLVNGQFVPDPRYLQTNAIINNSRWYFFGGDVGNNETDSNEVFYLELSKSFYTGSPTWIKDELGSPLTSIFSTSYVYPNNSSILIIGGVMVDPITQNFVSNSLAIYKYNLPVNNLSNSSWEVPKIMGIDNFTECGGLQAITDNTGRIFLYGGMRKINGPICNKMSIFFTNNMSWLTINLITSRVGYTATLHKSGNITYIGGCSTSNFSSNSYVSMNEILIFDTNTLSWHNITASGDNIGKRAFHSAVLTRDSKILIYGGSTILIYGGSKPGPAILDTSVYPFRWKSLYVKSFIAAPLPSLVSHSCIIYDDFMVIAFGRFTVEDQETLNNHVYIFDTISYKWVTTFDRNTPVPLYVIVLPIVAVIALIAFAICLYVIRQRKQDEGLADH